MQRYDQMDRVFYQRALLTKIASHSAPPQKIKLILGPRQSGKTTLLRHLRGSSSGVLELNLQDRKLRRQYEADEGRLVRELEATSAKETILIDEIQKVPALLDDVQYLYDKYPNRYRFLLTGSSSRQLKRRSANLLPGRVHLLLLPPVMLAEQRDCVLLPIEVPAGLQFPSRKLEDYLIYGNLPGIYQENQISWKETLAAYVELYIENEIRQEGIVHDMGAFVRFLQLSALASGQFTNFAKLARDVGVAPNTLRNFYQVLEDTYVGIRLPPFGRTRKRVIRAPRFIFFDVGVRHVLAELPLSQSLLTLHGGHMFEQWVLAELYYRCCFHGRGYGISTWRTASGAEVDAVVETPHGIMPVEVKWTERPEPRDARHLETFMDLHDNVSKRGYLICRTQTKQQLTDRTVALPWNEF
jgi:predicted AAA+ superfamily ATPase